MRPDELAAELGISGKTLRSWLRRTFPRPAALHGADWHLTVEQINAARAWRVVDRPPVERGQAIRRATRSGSRADSDEAYVVDLCDEILCEIALRQHRFGWLLGDPGRDGQRRKLPVDAYYPQHGLVVEYQERQHDRPVAHFDKPDVLTVSGVHRGEQRGIYDKRRETEIPKRGLRLIVVTPEDLSSDRRGRLRRERDDDLAALRRLLS